MQRQADALIRPDNDVAAVDAENHSAHAIDEANRFVQVLREKNPSQAPPPKLEDQGASKGIQQTSILGGLLALSKFAAAMGEVENGGRGGGATF